MGGWGGGGGRRVMVVRGSAVKRTPLPISMLMTDGQIWYACVGVLILFGYILLHVTYLVATETIYMVNYMKICITVF